MTQPSIGQDVVSFFETATPIKYSLVLTALGAGLLLILLLLGTCYLKIPQVLATILCYVSKKCCLRRKALQRNIDQTNLRVYYRAATALEPAQTALIPSAPNEPVSIPAHLSTQIPITLPFPGHRPLTNNSAICVNGHQDCFCVRCGPEKLIQCKQAFV